MIIQCSCSTRDDDCASIVIKLKVVVVIAQHLRICRHCAILMNLALRNSKGMVVFFHDPQNMSKVLTLVYDKVITNLTMCSLISVRCFSGE